ncbi:glycosyltransferase [Dysgonomonas sp. 216]|uniref:glycosyltransferase family 2 protein n=1 Tax=Dysgonomonas sp. 216 TaxID=2302934 RepID=UPI0013D47E47|nr:glycosyltransferase [Dysgonomonas sp. 216]NDW17544.1 glycosyltransferase [Dysgonomonas sp. 216]
MEKSNIEPLFSVLIAQYNNGRYLEEAISSVYNQTYKNWEIIIVDDCSADNSKEIYAKYSSDDRIKIFSNSINCGCGFTKRRCVEEAKGVICGFLDSDDALLPNALEKMVRIHVEKPNVGLVFSRFYYCDENLNIQTESRFLVIDAGKSYFTNRNYGPEHFASFKKQYYDKTTGLSANYRLGVDQDLYFKLEEVGDICVLNEFTYKYRFHKNGISSSSITRGFYWNLIVRHDTCLRRGLNPNDYPLLDLKDYTIFIKSEIYQSRSYRLGNLILKPINKIRKLIFKQN